MTNELEKKLFDKYPKLFGQKDGSPQDTCLCWGLEVPDSWYDLIDRMCSRLQFDIDRNKYPQLEFSQVKEKFGSGRFYYDYTENAFDHLKDEKQIERMCGVQEGVISIYENEVAHICDTCGTNKGIVETPGWIRFVCKDCLKKG